jgi:hypothetical protein
MFVFCMYVNNDHILFQLQNLNPITLQPTTLNLVCFVCLYVCNTALPRCNCFVCPYVCNTAFAQLQFLFVLSCLQLYVINENILFQIPIKKMSSFYVMTDTLCQLS